MCHEECLKERSNRLRSTLDVQSSQRGRRVSAKKEEGKCPIRNYLWNMRLRVTSHTTNFRVGWCAH